MPLACPGDRYVSRYKRLPGRPPRCHRLARWSLTLLAKAERSAGQAGGIWLCRVSSAYSATPFDQTKAATIGRTPNESAAATRCTGWAAPVPLTCLSRPREHQSTSSKKLSEWLLNSGAYMHWIAAMPVWYWPLCCTRVAYSKTYVPLGR